MQTLIVVSKSTLITDFHFIISNYVPCMEDPVQRIATTKTLAFMLFPGAKIPLRGQLRVSVGGNSGGGYCPGGNCSGGGIVWEEGQLSLGGQLFGGNCPRGGNSRGNCPGGNSPGKLSWGQWSGGLSSGGNSPRGNSWGAIVLESLKTLWEKEKLLITSNFSFSYNVFYPFQGLSALFIKVEIVCKLFQYGKV